jgi:hypothetical protein
LFRRTTEICALLAVTAGVAALPAAAAAEAPCPVEYCTDSSGKYELVVPPLTNLPIVGNAYADCIWDVHVDFGDGTSEDLVFDASVGLTGSHVFPAPGVTYQVQVDLTNGHHGDTSSCTDFTKTARVRYRTPAEEAGETPPPSEVVEQGGTPPAPIQVTVDIALPDLSLTPTVQGLKPVSFWRRCGGGVRTHGVACRKGRLVIDRAGEKLARRGSGPVAGFRCGLTSVAVVCRKGADRILGPPA